MSAGAITAFNIAWRAMQEPSKWSAVHPGFSNTWEGTRRMSETQNEQGEPQNPPTGDEAPPSVEPVTPPEATTTSEPVGRTPEAEAGTPPADGPDNGVGTAPTQAGDVDEEGNGGNTAFQTTEQIEDTDGDGDEDAA